MANPSEVIEQFITALIEGEPKHDEWASIDYNAMCQREYYARLMQLRRDVDALFEQGATNA